MYPNVMSITLYVTLSGNNIKGEHWKNRLKYLNVLLDEY